MPTDSADKTPTQPASQPAVLPIDADLQCEMDFIFGRINYERTTSNAYPRHFKLESMRRLLAELGDPQQTYSIIHVAGTKGKGSVSKMIAGALNESVILTGVYSSPHIESIRERMTVGGRMIDESQLGSVLHRTRAAVERLDERADREGFRKNSFFEIITAAALLHFADQSAEKVVLEVGLGGRLDSTNVCEPDLCVITNISLDHTKQLGSTVDLIAREKAGIIKRGVPVVSGVRDPLARKEVRETSSVNNCDLVELGEDFHLRIHPIADSKPGLPATRFDTHGTFPERHSYQMQQVAVNSAGQHQAVNAAIAIAALNMLSDRFRIPPAAIRRALEKFTMIGRGEVVCFKPLIVVDMAHNVASAEALVNMLTNLQASLDPKASRKLVFASSHDKDLPGMLKRLIPIFDEIVFTAFVENPRANDPKETRQIAERIVDELLNRGTIDRRPEMTVRPDPSSTWGEIQEGFSERDFLCVAGSAFLVAEMRPLITSRFAV